MIIFFFCLIKCKLMYLYLISYLVFRCPEFEGTGADSISVDGFHIDEHTWNAIIQECVSTFQTLVLKMSAFTGRAFYRLGYQLHASLCDQSIAVNSIKVRPFCRMCVEALYCLNQLTGSWKRVDTPSEYSNTRFNCKKKENEYRLSLWDPEPCSSEITGEFSTGQKLQRTKST